MDLDGGNPFLGVFEGVEPEKSWLFCSNVNDIETKAQTFWYRSLL